MSEKLPPLPRPRVVHWAESQQELHYYTPAEVEEIRRQTVLACATTVGPKRPRPCDCSGCHCGNAGSAQDVASWDEANANRATILALLETPHG